VASGKGMTYKFMINHQASPTNLNVPYALGAIDLNEEPDSLVRRTSILTQGGQRFRLLSLVDLVI
jgi:hypothetical protein